MFHLTEPCIHTVNNSLAVKVLLFADNVMQFVTVWFFVLQFLLREQTLCDWDGKLENNFWGGHQTDRGGQ